MRQTPFWPLSSCYWMRSPRPALAGAIDRPQAEPEHRHRRHRQVARGASVSDDGAGRVEAGGEGGAAMTRRRLAVLMGAGGLYLSILSFLTGVVVERVRFDRDRNSVLQRLAATQERLHTHLMDLERQTALPRHSGDR
jgi:hypothetical protein